MPANSSLDCSPLVYDLLVAWFCIYALFLPLFVLVLCVGCRRGAPWSSSDVFAVHLAAMELVNVLGACLFCAGRYAQNMVVMDRGQDLVFTAVNGQIFFHDLTCVERYLAVVHPITYLRLKDRGGARARQLSVASVWVLCAVMMSLPFQLFNLIVPVLLSILVVCFCTASVLCVLIRPRPGEVGGNRKGLDQSKRAAFYTMATILGVLLFRFLILIVSYMMFLSWTIDAEIKCLMSVASFWLALPSSLVCPLMFLRRVGRLRTLPTLPTLPTRK